VLRYAPLLFYSEYLNKLETLLLEYKRIERNTRADIAAKMAVARAKMWSNHRLWEYIESNPETRQDELRLTLGGDQDYWRSIAEAWDKMGLLRRIPEGGSYRLALRTRMGQIIQAKCSSCGESVEMPKAMVLEQLDCPACSRRAWFVIMTHEFGAVTRE
jgi:hypothetical protein